MKTLIDTSSDCVHMSIRGMFLNQNILRDFERLLTGMGRKINVAFPVSHVWSGSSLDVLRAFGEILESTVRRYLHDTLKSLCIMGRDWGQF